MAKARGSLSHFREAFESGIGGNYAIKVAIDDGKNVEHFWLVDIAVDGDGFKGILNNEPGLVSNVSFGDEITAAGDQISDWICALRYSHG